MNKMNSGETVLEARGITKRFPGVIANDKIDFEIKTGEIHAILGENGAGKSTLMKILFGQYIPDEGEILLHGEPVRFRSPLDAIERGIGMVYQHRKLVLAHSVIENIVLGHPDVSGVLNLKKASEEISELSKHYGFNVDLHAKVWQLSEGEKQAVEILKALYRGARILILDEPTSALNPLEVEKLLTSIEAMARDDFAIVPFITHKLPIVLRISDRVTVLRRGKVVSRMKTADATTETLAQELVGRDVIFRLERENVEPGDTVLEVTNLTAKNEMGLVAVDSVSFSIHEGEIFGIAGISGNGQTELVETIAGIRSATQGRVTLEGKDISRLSSLERWEHGLGYIPADRIDVGSIANFSLIENMAMNYYFDPDYSSRGVLNYRKIKVLTESLIEEYGVRTPTAETPAKALSGGNLQKLILARVFSRKPILVMAHLPTQGLDIGAMEFVRNKLLEAKHNRAAVLLISEDLDEILALSDRVAPIYEGKLMDIIPVDQVKRDVIGALMAGIELERTQQ